MIVMNGGELIMLGLAFDILGVSFLVWPAITRKFVRKSSLGTHVTIKERIDSPLLNRWIEKTAIPGYALLLLGFLLQFIGTGLS